MVAFGPIRCSDSAYKNDKSLYIRSLLYLNSSFLFPPNRAMNFTNTITLPLEYSTQSLLLFMDSGPVFLPRWMAKQIYFVVDLKGINFCLNKRTHDVRYGHCTSHKYQVSFPNKRKLIQLYQFTNYDIRFSNDLFSMLYIHQILNML